MSEHYFKTELSGSSPDSPATLNNLAESLNRAFAGMLTARCDGDEIVVQCEGKTAWIDQDGMLTGEASTPQTAP